MVLVSRLREAVQRLNPELTAAEIDEAVDKPAGYGAQSLVDGHKEVYDWLRNGVPVQRVEPDGRRTVLPVRAIDFDGANDLLAVRQFTVHGLKVRRPDIVPFVNGLPLVVIELKNPADRNADIEAAWNQIQTYKADIPQLFYCNLLNVISDGTVARYGSLTAEFGRYSRWRLLGGEKVAKGRLELDVLMLGLFEPRALLAVQAAKRGQGVMLGREAFISEKLASGQLVRLMRKLPSLRTFDYYIVYPQGFELPRKSRAFRDWMLEQVGGASH